MNGSHRGKDPEKVMFFHPVYPRIQPVYLNNQLMHLITIIATSVQNVDEPSTTTPDHIYCDHRVTGPSTTTHDHVFCEQRVDEPSTTTPDHIYWERRSIYEVAQIALPLILNSISNNNIVTPTFSTIIFCFLF